MYSRRINAVPFKQTYGPIESSKRILCSIIVSCAHFKIGSVLVWSDDFQMPFVLASPTQPRTHARLSNYTNILANAGDSRAESMTLYTHAFLLTIFHILLDSLGVLWNTFSSVSLLPSALYYPATCNNSDLF